ncbi:hypothetical protein TNCT_111761 [Trichonephila clavata]|uniref:EGF-like domain-containing protein n=1 Tax=Trichonephila clavata TaxID=2740835 RepID=A0A8X6L6U6_TRICU|nr:hypothetical protein TNCT_111761 [Trichonephila clavata]
MNVRQFSVESQPYAWECREDSPCQHLCFDLHDGTFECACKDGFTLSVNGYSCIGMYKKVSKNCQALIEKDVEKIEEKNCKVSSETNQTSYSCNPV